ncbi:MAG: Sll0314/Alr1548 family TPR repeat-containing protein [Cyanobacteria bacterium J06559_3]
MTNLVMGSIQKVFSRKAPRRLGLMLAGVGAVLLLGQPAFAGDPFRAEEPHDISDASEQLFYAMFRDGDYAAAQQYVDSTDASAESDPMFHAMSAALHYLEEDWEGMQSKAALTKETAIALAETDPLRGNLYEAVGIFLDGAYILQTEGIAQGTPRALAMLQQVFNRLDEAEAIDPEDPELSLIKGFMDLLLAVNLPFANPERAIEHLGTYGKPDYVAYRGIAVGYRDLDRNEEALQAIERAIAASPENPDLLYLKAQILVRLDRDDEGIEFFEQALAYQDQLPAETAEQIEVEQCKATGERGSVCRERIRNEQEG